MPDEILKIEIQHMKEAINTLKSDISSRMDKMEENIEKKIDTLKESKLDKKDFEPLSKFFSKVNRLVYGILLTSIIYMVIKSQS